MRVAHRFVPIAAAKSTHNAALRSGLCRELTGYEPLHASPAFVLRKQLQQRLGQLQPQLEQLLPQFGQLQQLSPGYAWAGVSWKAVCSTASVVCWSSNSASSTTPRAIAESERLIMNGVPLLSDEMAAR